MIFDAAITNDVGRLERFINKFGNDVNERNEDGLTCLHICATKGHFEGVCCLLGLGAQVGFADFENGWTALHYSIYYNHPRISLVLIQCGAILDNDVLRGNEQALVIDKEGFSPLQLLSTALTTNLKSKSNYQSSGNIVSYGKSDLVLGVPLPKAVNVLRPKRIDSLIHENIISVSSAKYHNLALSSEGKIWSWGHGKNGKLGHGDEFSQPEPKLLHFPYRIRFTVVSVSETHSLALTDNGDVYSWGSDRFGQLGLGSASTNTQTQTNTNLKHQQQPAAHHRSNTTGNLETHRMYTTPTRIESLRKETVLGIAAGETHSLCYTSNNELYAWGNNKHGQCALRFVDTTAGNAGQQVNIPKKVKFSLSIGAAGGSSGSAGSHFGSLDRQSTKGGMMIVQVVAGQFSSLLLTRSLISCREEEDRLHSIRFNTFKSDVYQWGDGVFQPRKIHFPRGNRSRENSVVDNDNVFESSFDSLRHDHSQIIMICAGKHHFLALSKAGSVYSWGLGMDQLGHGHHLSNTNSHVSVPMVIEALHPDKTKSGKVIYIAAAGHRSAVVTTIGEVFTWGTTTNASAQYYRPVPEREVGIRRAVKVSLTEDSTFVLASASIPTIPTLYPGRTNGWQNMIERRIHAKTKVRSNNRGSRSHLYHSDDDDDDDSDYEDEESQAQELPTTDNTSSSNGNSNVVPSLQAICQTQLCSTVNMKNAIDALLFSEQHCAFILETYCLQFISLNLDALLVQLKPKNLDHIASEWCSSLSLSSSSVRNRKPSWDYYTATAASSPGINNHAMKNSRSMKSSSISPTSNTVAAVVASTGGGRRQQSSSGSNSQKDSAIVASTVVNAAAIQNQSSRKNLEAVETVEEMQRLIRSTKKKLVAIDDIILHSSSEKEKIILTPEQKEKINKKGGLQLDLMKMEQMLVRLQQREQRNNNTTTTTAAEKTVKQNPQPKGKQQQQQVMLSSFDQWSAMLMLTEEEQVMYLLQQTALEASSPPLPPVALAVNAAKQPPAAQQQPKGAAWSTISTNNNKQQQLQLQNQASPASSIPTPTLSSSTPSGRTVLSPPEPPSPALPSLKQQPGLVQVQTRQVQAVVVEDAAVSMRATFETSCSLADFITPNKKSTNAAKKMLFKQQQQSPSLAASPVPAVGSGEKMQATSVGGRKPAAASPWGKPSALTVTTAAALASSSSQAPINLSSSSSLSTPTKHKKLSDIVAEEEKARLNSNMTSLRGNNIPWLIERKPRAESFERLVAEQLCAKQDEEERLLKVAAEAEAIAATEKKKTKKNKNKEKKKQHNHVQQQQPSQQGGGSGGKGTQQPPPAALPSS